MIHSPKEGRFPSRPLAHGPLVLPDPLRAQGTDSPARPPLTFSSRYPGPSLNSTLGRLEGLSCSWTFQAEENSDPLTCMFSKWVWDILWNNGSAYREWTRLLWLSSVLETLAASWGGSIPPSSAGQVCALTDCRLLRRRSPRPFPRFSRRTRTTWPAPSGRPLPGLEQGLCWFSLKPLRRPFQPPFEGSLSLLADSKPPQHGDWI